MAAERLAPFALETPREVIAAVDPCTAQSCGATHVSDPCKRLVPTTHLTSMGICWLCHSLIVVQHSDDSLFRVLDSACSSKMAKIFQVGPVSGAHMLH
eukprot:1289982-Amphidinium_carterae.1